MLNWTVPRASARPGENSEVAPLALVAVDVTNWPDGKVTGTLAVIGALPLPSVVTVVVPRKRSPSPEPEGSRVVLAKNWIVKVVFGMLWSVPRMIVPEAVEAIDVRVGGTWSWLAPGPRSIPSPPLEKMLVERMLSPVPDWTLTPAAMLNAIVL